MPYLLRRDGDQVFMYGVNTNLFADSFNEATDLLDDQRMEWTLMTPPAAYEAILELRDTMSHYEQVSNNQQVAFFNQVAPITQYSAAFFSPDYTEGGAIKISTENHMIADVTMDVPYVHSLTDDVLGFIDDMSNNRYGYAAETTPKFDDGDFHEAGLSRVINFWWGTFIPIYLLGGVGIGAARAGTSAVRASAGNRRKTKAPSV